MTFQQTISLAEQLLPLGNVEVFEDPIPKSDLDGYIRIHEAIDLPVAMHLGGGEQIVRAVKAGVVDCLNLNGGPADFMRSVPSGKRFPSE